MRRVGPTSWRVRGAYLESCNCDAICPCRTIDGRPGGRSTHGTCEGVLSWVIDEGSAGAVDLADLSVAMAIRYSDDEPGSPWSFVLYLDERATAAQREALRRIFSGELGGDAKVKFPWARKPSVLLAVRDARFELDRTPRRQRLRVRDFVSLTIRGGYEGDESVTCVIPGHEVQGSELVADELVVTDSLLRLEHRGNCGYQATFDYRG